MQLPPVTEFAKWRPDHWITQTGYALTPADIEACTKGKPAHCQYMIEAVLTTQHIIERMMQS